MLEKNALSQGRDILFTRLKNSNKVRLTYSERSRGRFMTAHLNGSNSTLADGRLSELHQTPR